MVVAGCGDEDAGERPAGTTRAATGPHTTPETTAVAEDVQRCRNEQAGFRVGYPADWHTNSGDVAPRCAYFHPEPFEVPRNQEFFGAAISIRREPVAFSRVTGEDPATEVIERERVQVDGRPAVRRLTRSTGAALLPEGTRAYQYIVDVGEETIIASTYDVGDHEFDRNQRVLDDMADRLELTGG